MVRTALAIVPSVAPPSGDEIESMTVSFASPITSFVIGTLKVVLDWPSLKMAVPDVNV